GAGASTGGEGTRRRPGERHRDRIRAGDCLRAARRVVAAWRGCLPGDVPEPVRRRICRLLRAGAARATRYRPCGGVFGIRHDIDRCLWLRAAAGIGLPGTSLTLTREPPSGPVRVLQSPITVSFRG